MNYELIIKFYQTIKEAAGENCIILGCNTVSHLCAGMYEVNRTGNDTSGFEWAKTRMCGVNALAFRLIQNGIFYMADADCVGITGAIPWELNRMWLDILARSGSPLFVSCKPGVLNDNEISELSNDELCLHKMTESQKKRAVVKLKVASTLQYTVFGVPSVYYGDEAGLEGGHDPFCRQPFPWGAEDADLVEHYKKLGEIRKENSVFSDGRFKIIDRSQGFIAFERYNESENMLVVANIGKASKGCNLRCDVVNLLDGKRYNGALSVAPNTAMILKLV